MAEKNAEAKENKYFCAIYNFCLGIVQDLYPENSGLTDGKTGTLEGSSKN